MKLDQIVILTVSVSATLLSQSKNPRVQRWSSILGLLGQPAWFYASWQAGQWGILLSCFLYTAAWGKGFWSFWIAPWWHLRKARALLGIKR